MKKELELLHAQMVEELEAVTRSSKDEKEMSESAFWLSNAYWDKAKEMVRVRGFKDENEEIEFFKVLKPKFTCRIEYFILISGALSFVPSDQEKAMYFWQEEERKYQRFRTKNEDFISYYERGSTEMDAIYFKRVCEDRKPLLKLINYDNDPEFCSANDYLVRSLVAHKMYDEYVKGRLHQLVGNDEMSEK